MRSKRTRLIAGALVLAGVLGACGGSGDGAVPRETPGSVSITGFLFKPEKVTVPAGTTVTWTNHDDIAHTVTGGAPGAPSGAFDSGNKVKDETFSHVFPSAGTFPYFCSNHNGMRGEVAVT